MPTEKELLELLCRKAAVQPKVAAARVAAGIVHPKKGLVSLGFNSYKTHPLQLKFSGDDKKISLHAETDAIIRYLRMGYTVESLEDCSLYVARVKNCVLGSYKTGLAKPCAACQKAIIHYNLKDVIWTEDE